MTLTEQQTDGLTELINIAFGRTAVALSTLTGHRVLLEVPRVAVLPFDALAAELARFVPGEVATIRQAFAGALSGDALLILSHADAVALNGLLTEEAGPEDYLDESAREVVTEIGNILLNACLSMFGNLLGVRLRFSVPRLSLDPIADVVAGLARPDEDLRHAIMVSVAFKVKGSAVAGCLALVLGVASLAQVIAEVEAWEARAERAS